MQPTWCDSKAEQYACCMSIQFTQKDIDRFLSYVEKLPNGCHFWTGARSRGKGNRKWYGSFRVGRKVVRAHRFACEALANPPKPCPPEHDRDHTCLFSLCVNPDHLEVVHKTENQRRKIARRKEIVVSEQRLVEAMVQGSL